MFLWKYLRSFQVFKLGQNHKIYVLYIYTFITIPTYPFCVPYGHHSLVLQVHFVTDKNDWNSFVFTIRMYHTLRKRYEFSVLIGQCSVEENSVRLAVALWVILSSSIIANFTTWSRDQVSQKRVVIQKILSIQVMTYMYCRLLNFRGVPIFMVFRGGLDPRIPVPTN